MIFLDNVGVVYGACYGGSQQYFNYIVEVSLIGGWNQRKPQICLKSLTHFITYYCIEYTSPWTGFELTTLVVIICWQCSVSFNEKFENTKGLIRRGKLMKDRQYNKQQTNNALQNIAEKTKYRATRTQWKLPFIQVFRFGKHRHRAVTNN